MKVYYYHDGNCEEISLGEALRLVFDRYELGSWTYCADMLHKSDHTRTITVEGGHVWIEDELDIDKVAKDWWHLRSKDLPRTWVHLIISCCNDPWILGSTKVQYVGHNHVFYDTSEEALATFKEATDVPTTPQSQVTEQQEDNSL